MLKGIKKTIVLCFVVAALSNFTPSSAGALDKVHQEITAQGIIAEIFVTSW